ncbi:hypothetical protein DsansV1_C07g0071811 [Dioscorea sansibarensis]
MPTPNELFHFTHMKKHDGQTFIGERSKSLDDKVVKLREASQVNSGSGNDIFQSIDKMALYYQTAGGEKKKRCMALDLNRLIILYRRYKWKQVNCKLF